MSDYTNTFGGAAKDSANDTILGAAHDTEYDNIATMSATKANKVTSPTANRILLVDGSGDLSQASGLSYASAVLSSTTANSEIRLGNRALADGDGTLRISSYGDGITSNDWIGVNVQGSSGAWTQGRAGDGAGVIGFDTRAQDAILTLRAADDDASVGATPGWNVQLDLNANALNPTFDVDIAGTQRFQVTSSGAEVDGNFFIDAGDLIIEETADHSSTPTAGRGLLWVKNDTPNTLQFTDDAGTDHAVIQRTQSPVATGHVRMGNTQRNDGNTTTITGFNATSVITEATFETVGPTGSGATNIVANMDDMPSNAAAVIFLAVGELTTSGVGDGELIVYGVSNDIASPTAAIWNNGLASWKHDPNAASQLNGGGQEIVVPVDADNICKLTWSQDQTSARSLILYYRGFITDD